MLNLEATLLFIDLTKALVFILRGKMEQNFWHLVYRRKNVTTMVIIMVTFSQERLYVYKKTGKQRFVHLIETLTSLTMSLDFCKKIH